MNIVAHNILAMNAQRMYGINTNSKKKSSEKLSSGYKINRAADDAAGLSISEKMRKQIRGLRQGSENLQDGISFCQTADGYLNEAVDMLHRMNELSIKAANGTLSASDRLDVDNEIQELKEESDRIFKTAKFNETHIFTVPYVPAPVINGDDMQIFSNGLDSTGNVKYGGIELNDVRHTWDELGIKLSSDGKTFASDQEVSFHDYTGELVELHVKGGDPLSEILRRNYWSADEKGVYINDVFAQTWDEIGISEGANNGEYCIKFKHQDIYFEVESGDNRGTVMEKINAKNMNVKYSWDIMTSKYGEGNNKAVDISLSNNIRITNNNKNNIDPAIKYSIDVYGTGDDGGITIRSTDGVQHTEKSWTDLGVTDWGLTDRDGKGLDSDLKTFDDGVTYNYTNNANTDLPISFDIRFADEAGFDEVVRAIDDVSLNQTIIAPGNMNKSISAGLIGGNKPGISLSVDSLRYVEQKAYNRNFDVRNAQLTGSVTRVFTNGSFDSTDTTVSGYIRTGYQSPANRQSKYNVYLKIGDKYYRRNKVTDTYNINEKWTDTITDLYKNAKYTYTGSFANVSVNEVSQDFDYTKVTKNSRDKSSTRTHIYYEQVDPSDRGYDADELDQLFPGGWTREDTDASSDITTVDKDDTVLLSTHYQSSASQTINIPSAISGNSGFNLTVSDSTDTLGNANISLNFTATDYATVTFSADERGYNHGNKNDHVEMRKFSVNVPMKDLPIQTSSNNPDHISLKWSGLNNAIIGIKGTNTKTIEEARYAIDEVAGAIKMVSDTRSVFGAQQNRLEHAVRQNDNTAENTQAAESLIRDTDMAREMVKFSITSILMQAGEAMMGQANQSNQGVLSLIA